MDFVIALRVAYAGAAGGILLVFLIPSFRDRFLAYGPRSSAADTSSATGESGVEGRAAVSKALDGLASIRVPHAWFSSFYALSLACLTFWAAQYCAKGVLLDRIARAVEPRSKTMTARQAMAAWVLLAIQAARRLTECHTLERSSTSSMWIGHWLLGIGFYCGTSVAIWVEGARPLLNHIFTLDDLTFGNLDLRTFISTTLFILASGFQYDCHTHLASLKLAEQHPSKQKRGSYSLPDHPAFHRLICPHYTAECVIYLSLALFAAPQGAWMNVTMLCVLVLVFVNLGVTAAGTKTWYETSFGREAIRGKWKMIPYLF